MPHEVPIDLIFGADNLRPPLTGIGRYAFELARRLEQNHELERIRYFSLGRWVKDPLRQLYMGESAEPSAVSFATIQSMLASVPVVVKAYNWFSPTMYAMRLHSLTDRQIYHAPNFFAPKCKARKVVTVHDLSHEVHPECHPMARVDLMKHALPRSLQFSDHVITVSETVRQEVLQRFGLHSDRVTAIPLAADAIFKPQSTTELDPAMHALGLKSRGYTLFVGTVEPRKNVQRLVAAYSMLPAELRHAYPLVIAGGVGWNSAEAHQAIARGVEEGWLRYLAFVEQRWLPALYAGARLMAYPSLYEGFGLPIVEAMASGTPVLTSNVSCMPEVAAGAARLVNPLDVDHIANSLEQCLTDELWQSEAIDRGLTRASQLSWDRCADETVAVYQSLL